MFINVPVKVPGDKVGPSYSSQKLPFASEESAFYPANFLSADEDGAADNSSYLVLGCEADLPLDSVNLTKMIGELPR